MKAIHEAINAELDETQKRYDEQSSHSINTEVQLQWQQIIAKELLKLEEFKSI